MSLGKTPLRKSLVLAHRRTDRLQNTGHIKVAEKVSQNTADDVDSRSFIPIQCGHIIRNDRSRDIRQIYPASHPEITQKLLQLCTLDINRTSRPVVFGTVTKIILQYAGVPDRHPVIVAADSPAQPNW